MGICVDMLFQFWGVSLGVELAIYSGSDKVDWQELATISPAAAVFQHEGISVLTAFTAEKPVTPKFAVVEPQSETYQSKITFFILFPAIGNLADSTIWLFNIAMENPL